MKIAYLGMGIMGSAMAQNLHKAAYDLKVWNRSQQSPRLQAAVAAGCKSVGTIEEAVSEADIVLSCLSDVADVEEVLSGSVKHFIKPGTIVVDMATTGKNLAEKLGKEFHAVEAEFLDAPVTGGDIGARNGTLTIMVGGNPEAFAKALPVFQAMGKVVKHCGEVGAGQAVKMCNQVLCAVNMVAVCEALSLAKELNLAPELVLEVCSSGAAGSWALSNLGPRMAAGDLNPGFMIKDMLKDLNLVLGALPADHVLPGVELAAGRFNLAATAAGTNGMRLGTQAMIEAYKLADCGAKALDA